MSERESPGFKVHLEEEVGTNWREEKGGFKVDRKWEKV